jgi:hypothetical protein
MLGASRTPRKGVMPKMTATQFRGLAVQMQEEASLISAVVNYLNFSGYCAWRQQNTGHFNKTRAADSVARFVHGLLTDVRHGKQMNMFSAKTKSEALGDLRKQIEFILSNSWEKVPDSIKGVADVIGYNKSTGRWIAVEIKIGTDRLSSDQEVWLKGLSQAGGEVWLCRDINSFIDAHRAKANKAP